MQRDSMRIFRIGAIGMVIAIGLMLLPLLLPHSSVNRFLVAIGFIALCWSLSCLLNGLWDLIRKRGEP